MASRIFTHLVLVLGLFSAVSLKAQQVTFTLSPSTVSPNVGDTVRLNVVVNNFTNVISFQFAMDWDANLFQFVSADNKDNMPDRNNLDFNNYTPGAMITVWSSVGAAPRTVANGTTIFRLNLKVKAPSNNYWARFTGEGTNIEVIQNGSPVSPSFGNLGNPPDGSSTPITVKTSSHTIQANQNICVGITADNFSNMVSAKWQLKWDSTVLRYESLTGLNTTLGLGLNTNFVTTQAVANGRLNFNWSSSTARTVPTGDTLYKVCFTGIGAAGSSTTISTLVAGSEAFRSNSGSNTLIGVTPQNGTVNISTLPPSSSGLTFSGTTVTGKVGDTVCVKVYAKNFKDMGFMGFSMHWDSTKMSFGKARITNTALGAQDELILPNPPPTSVAFSPNLIFTYRPALTGTLIIYNDLSGLNNGNGVTLLGDSSLVFEVCLRINSGEGTTVPFRFDGVPIKVSNLDKDGTKINTTFVSGNIIIESSGPPAIVASGNATNVNCNGGSTGAVALTVSGGTGSYIYNWSGPNFTATSKDVSNLKAGKYYVTISSGAASPKIDSFTITEPTAITATKTTTNVNCFGQSTGGVILTPTGGTSPYTYAWSSGETSKDIASKAAGQYIVTITDARNCTIRDTSNITQPAAMATTKAITDVSCFGQSTGSATLTPTGGTSPYTYVWSSGETTKDITNKAAGQYIVTITDARNCIIRDTANITQPVALTTSKTVANVNCFGQSTGSVVLTPTGGISPYTYAWSSGETTKDISAKAAGQYIVTITDARNCTLRDTSNITQPTAAISLSQTVTNIVCHGASTGAISLTVAGGTSPYTYSWTDGSSFSATTKDITNIKAGNYSVTVTDSKGCAQTLGPIAVTSGSAIIVTPSVTAATCGQANGSITITSTTGGQSPYSYKWIGANNFSATTQNIANLAAGSYVVEITDANSCKITATPISVSSANPTFSLSHVGTDVSCNGGDNGKIDLTVTGGNGNFTYTWSGPGSFAATTKDITGLKAGSYIVTITETGTSCQVVSSAIVIAEPSVLTIGQPQKTDVSCKGGTTGTIAINVSGGSGAYTYSWRGPDNFTAINTPSISTLKAGTYNVTVTDGKSCTATTSVVINEPATGVTIGQPTIVNATCNGGTNGSININVQGGTPQYSYAWSNQSTSQNLTAVRAGNYTVTVTDAGGCTDVKTFEVKQPAAINISGTTSNSVVGCIGNITLTVEGGTVPYSYAWTGPGISNPTSKDQSSLCPNETYTVTVTDANNCTATKQFTITGQVAPPIRLTDSTVISQAGCPGQNLGAINITFTGGQSPFTFEWTNASGAIVWREQNLRDRTAGRYRVKITDALGQSYLSGAIEIKESASTININVTATTPETCEGNNGEITLDITGGSAPYKFTWNDGPTSKDRRNIRTGTYSVTVSDASACLTEKNNIRVDKQLCTLAATSTNKGNNCFGDKNGSITVNIQNGEPGYVIRWSANDSVRVNNSPRRDASYEIRNLAGGTYVVTITDARGQVSTVTETVAQPSQIVINRNINNDGGNCSGSVVLSITGGSPTYSYAWNDGAQSRDRFNVCANSILSVTVTDSKGCFASTPNDTVKAIIIPSVCATVRINTIFDGGFNLKCASDKNGSASVSAVTDLTLTPPFQYRWDNGETGPTSVQLPSGARTVTVVGANGRTCVANFIMSAPQEIKVLIIPNRQNCSLTANASGGVAPYTFSWSTAKGDTTASIGGLKSNDKFFVIVKDKFGCTTDPGIGTAECQEFCLKGPGVLTPNEDGKNDKFTIQRCDFNNVRLLVYNRWGQLVYENNNYVDQWEGNERDGKDGKELPEGVYMYILRALQPNGIEKIEKNTISILRQ